MTNLTKCPKWIGCHKVTMLLGLSDKVLYHKAMERICEKCEVIK